MTRPNPNRGTAEFRRLRRERALRLARSQDGMLSRRQLYRAEINRWEIRAEIRAGRWGGHRRSQAVRVGPPNRRQRWWKAIFDVGPQAVIDGISALVAAGLQGIDEDVIHVAVPKSSTPRRCKGVRVHETRRYSKDDIAGAGLPRMRPATAAVHAALWARSDEQAALYLVAVVQQGLTTVAKLAGAIGRIRHDPRLGLLHSVLQDIAAGVHSIGELEFARLCSERRLPVPTRQAVRETPTGRRYVDADFDPWGVTVEIEGAQHLEAAMASADALKQNESCLDGRLHLRIPVWALRTNPDPFMDQLEAALISRGWSRAEAEGGDHEGAAG